MGDRLHDHVFHAVTCLPMFLRCFPNLYNPSIPMQQRKARITSKLQGLLKLIREVCEVEFGPQHDPWSSHMGLPCMVAVRSRVIGYSCLRWSNPKASSWRLFGTVRSWCGLRSQYLQVRLKPGMWEYAHRLQLWCAKGVASSPEATITLHLCQRRSCQQPRHLTWGTSQDNLKGPTNRIVSKNLGEKKAKRNKDLEVDAAMRRMEG